MRTKLRLYGLAVGCTAVMFFVFPAHGYADVLGDQKTFFVNEDFDFYERATLQATLKHVSTRAYFYVDDFYWQKLSGNQQNILVEKMQSLGGLFDNQIYPLSVAFWGSDNTPGIDNDPRITILLEPLDTGNGGYFDTIHNFPRTPTRDSNEREMIFLSIDALGGDLIPVFLGHELQHLISSNQKERLRNTSDEVWLNEARSEYTATVLNQNTPYHSSSLARRVTTFLNQPSDSLTEWKNATTDYGIAAVFAEYLVGRFGSKILVESLQSPYSGIDSINNFLLRNNHTEHFTDLFFDWMIASYINDTTSSQYSYAKPELQTLKVRPDARPALTSNVTGLTFSLKDWQPLWVEYVPTQSNAAAIKLEISGTPSKNPFAALVVYFTDGSYDVVRADFVQGNRTIHLLNGKNRVSDEKQIQKVVLVTTFTQRQSGFTVQEGAGQISIQSSLLSETDLAAARQAVSMVNLFFPGTAQNPAQPQASGNDGMLIKRNNNEPETYVVSGKYKRYLRPEIIKLYGHLSNANTLPIASSLFDSYVTANYVRYVNDKKVYAIWPDGTKHWLNISAEQFTSSGRDWNAIFIINEAELNSYTTGADIRE